MTVEIDVAHIHLMGQRMQYISRIIPSELLMGAHSQFFNHIHLAVKQGRGIWTMTVLVHHHPATVSPGKNFSAIAHGKVAKNLDSGLFRNPQVHLETFGPEGKVALETDIYFRNNPVQASVHDIESGKKLARRITGKTILEIGQGRHGNHPVAQIHIVASHIITLGKLLHLKPPKVRQSQFRIIPSHASLLYFL